MQERTNCRRRTALKFAEIGAAGLWSRLSFAAAQVEEKAEENNFPKSSEEHFARARRYDAKAKEYRQEAALHKKMLTEEIEALPPKLKSAGPEPGWVQKMRKHCEGYIRQAEALAREAEQFAEFHRMRGREMKGE